MIFSYSGLVYVTTSANPNEDSYACYYDKERQIYLGDVYSVNWMENSDAVCILRKHYFTHVVKIIPRRSRIYKNLII